MNTSERDIPTKFLLQEQGDYKRLGQEEKKQQRETENQNVDLNKGASRIINVRPRDRYSGQIYKEKAKLFNQQENLSFGQFNPQNTPNLTQNCTFLSVQDQPTTNLPDDRLQTFIYMNEIQKIKKKQSTINSQSRHILCKLTTIIICICLFFITLLKVFLFFSTQFIATVIQSFKSQLFDPAITNDQLELEIFYIQQACFLLTTVLLFSFVVFCTIMAKKYYVGSLRVYKRNQRVFRGLKERQDEVRKKVQEIVGSLE